jgi:transcriptional regulator with XRE-family HTH domain
VYYNTIFFTNVLQQLQNRHMTKTELSELSGVSISFLSDLTTGKGNPSLEVMEKIAVALDVPLSFLLESTDLDMGALKALREGRVRAFDVPSGYERIVAILPEHRAFQVKKWAEEAKEKLKHQK